MISPDSSQYVVLRRFWAVPEALAAKGVLDASGIESFIADENTIHMTSSNLGGVRLFVKRSEAANAAAALDEASSP